MSACTRDARPRIRLYRHSAEFLSIASSQPSLVSSSSRFATRPSTPLDSPPSPPFFAESTCELFISLPFSLHLSLSLSIVLLGDVPKVIGTRVPPIHRRTYTCWTNSPLGHPSDKHNHECRKTHARSRGCSRRAAVPPANYFCLTSLKTITSLRV